MLIHFVFNSLCIYPAVVLGISIYLIRQTQLFRIIDGFIILLFLVVTCFGYCHFVFVMDTEIMLGYIKMQNRNSINIVIKYFQVLAKAYLLERQ
jgi:hypothetical protein